MCSVHPFLWRTCCPHSWLHATNVRALNAEPRDVRTWLSWARRVQPPLVRKKAFCLDGLKTGSEWIMQGRGIKKKKIHLQEEKKGVSVKRKGTNGQKTGGSKRHGHSQCRSSLRKRPQQAASEARAVKTDRRSGVGFSSHYNLQVHGFGKQWGLRSPPVTSYK